MDNNTKPELFESEIYQPLLARFAEISDKRCKRGIRYKLKPIFILLFMSKLGGADKSAEIADWVKFRFDKLKTLLSLDWERSPHEVTWKRIIEQGLKAEEVEKVFGEYLQEMSEAEKRLYNLDGKVVCGVIPQETNKRLHLLALQESESNLTVVQTALQAGENEISGAKRLLGKVDLAGKIISGDAIFAQTELSKIVLDKGGEYLWKLRANQGNIYKLAVEHFAKKEDKYLGQASSVEKGHGRIDEREIFTSFRLAGSLEFPYVAQGFRITRRNKAVKTSKVSEQAIYGITSLSVEEFGAKELLELTRKHWGIENGLHYRRDVTFKEDAVRKESKNGGQIMAALNNLAIGVLRKMGWENLAKARRFYDAQIEKGLELITNPIAI